jgi:hypothetical protein
MGKKGCDTERVTWAHHETILCLEQRGKTGLIGRKHVMMAS